MIRILMAALFLIIPISLEAQAGPTVPPINSRILIPGPIKGNLVIYQVGFTQCSMFLSDEGMAKGTVQPNCVLLPHHEVPEGGYEFEIIDVIKTTDD